VIRRPIQVRVHRSFRDQAPPPQAELCAVADVPSDDPVLTGVLTNFVAALPVTPSWNCHRVRAWHRAGQLWQVAFMEYELGFSDKEQDRVELSPG